MHLEATAIVCSVLPHGEHGAVVRFLTADDGLVAGYVHGGRSRAQRPVLQPGNGVFAVLRSRTDSQLPGATVELTAARAALATTATQLGVLTWSTALTARALPELVPQPRLFTALGAIIDAIAAGASPLSLGEAVVRYELLLLGELGFGLDLSACAATGATTDLGFVSPRSARAVSRSAAAPFAGRLLPLPGFLLGTDPADGAAISAGFQLTQFFLARHVLTGQADLLAERGLLSDRWR